MPVQALLNISNCYGNGFTLAWLKTGAMLLLGYFYLLPWILFEIIFKWPKTLVVHHIICFFLLHILCLCMKMTVATFDSLSTGFFCSKWSECSRETIEDGSIKHLIQEEWPPRYVRQVGVAWSVRLIIQIGLFAFISPQHERWSTSVASCTSRVQRLSSLQFQPAARGMALNPKVDCFKC